MVIASHYEKLFAYINHVCCGLFLLLVEIFFKPAHFFLTSLFFQTRNIMLNQLIYQLSEKGFLSFGVWFKNRGVAFWGV